MPAVESKMRITSAAVTFVPLEFKKDGRVDTTHMTYTRKGWTSIRQPTETCDPGETIRSTIHSGVPHEMACSGEPFRFELILPDPVFKMIVPDQENVGGMHLKVAYAIRTYGKLRYYDLPDGDAIMGPITLMDIGNYLKLTSGKTVKFHTLATIAALAKVVESAKDESVFNLYWQYIAKHEDFRFSHADSVAIQEQLNK